MKHLFFLILIFIVQFNARAQSSEGFGTEPYYGVYRFSDSVMGLTFELGYESKIDSIFGSYLKVGTPEFEFKPMDGSIAVDTSGRFYFYKQPTFSADLMRFAAKKYYVVCQRGIVKRTPLDVVYAMDECRSSVVVFRFDAIDTTKYGQPLICSTAKPKFKFHPDPAFDQEATEYKQELEYDYSDEMRFISVASSDSLVVVYSDNFKWNYTQDSGCLFPGRYVFEVSKESISSIWGFSLDLFGIPCD